LEPISAAKPESSRKCCQGESIDSFQKDNLGGKRAFSRSTLLPALSRLLQKQMLDECDADE